MNISPAHQAALAREWTAVVAASERALELVQREGVTTEELRVELPEHAADFNAAFRRATAVLNAISDEEVRAMASMWAHRTMHGDGGIDA